MSICTRCRQRCFPDRLYQLVQEIDYASGECLELADVCVKCTDEIIRRNSWYMALSRYFASHIDELGTMRQEHEQREEIIE